MTYVTKRSLFSLIAGVSIVGLIWYFNLIALGYVGCLLMALGGLLAATDRRYRAKVRSEQGASSAVGASA